jgi:hypothetical protein
MSIAAAVRIRDSRVFANIIEYGRRSLRKIAQATGLSKSSVARSLDAMDRRNKYPESHLWETDEGQAWLRILVLAAIYVFGIKGNQGAERVTEFFELIRVNTHVGTSPSALRDMMRRMEEELVEFQRKQEAEQKQKGDEKRDIVASGDETWFDDKMVLILMDLVSGYIVVEEEAEDRSYATWEAKAQSRLKALGLRVRHFISDRGKSLVKLAISSLGCLAGADIFHAQYDISKWLGRALHGKFGRASKQLREAEEKKTSLEEKGAGAEKIAEQKQRIEQCREKLEVIEEGRQAYSEAQRSVSAAVHAFSAEDNTPQSSEQVENRLEERAQCFEQIAEKQSVKDTKNTADKFRRQIEDVASIVDAWWLWTKESLVEFKLGPEVRYWLLYVLLPVIYWHHQLQKTQNPDMKELYQAAWQAAHAAYAVHPVTQTVSKEDLDRWRSWGEWASGNFHRASSAVEGRNGCLSQSYHNSRGLTNHRMGALTSIHNYDTRRRDGTTPAERLYGVQFPGLFDWLLGRMGALPLPRQARPRAVHNPLDVDTVPP